MLPIIIVLSGILLVFSLIVRSWGTLAALQDEGFEMKPLLGRARLYQWSDLGQPIRAYPAPWPRLEFRLRDQGFMSATSRSLIFLRKRELDARFLARLRDLKILGEVIRL